MTLESDRERGRSQFSVRDLLVGTTAVSVALTIAALSRNSSYWSALSRPWTWTSLSLVAAVLVAYRRMPDRRLWARRSKWVFILSMVVPALRFGGGADSELSFGGQAFLECFVFGWGYLENLVVTHNPRAYWPVSNDLPFACTIGGIANLLLIGGWIAYWVSRRRGHRPTVGRWMGGVAFVLMFSSLIPIAWQGDLLTSIYPGFGLWAASALMCALGE